MSIDAFQEKIRKKKNPSVLEFCISMSDLPPHILEAEPTPAAAYGRFCKELIYELKDSVPAVRFGFASFAMLGGEGLEQMIQAMQTASEQGLYVLMDAPEILSPAAAKITAEAVLGENSIYPCDGLIIPTYPGSDVVKPFLPYLKRGNKDVFAVVRTANKSASELQDLLAGSRLVHAAAADHVNRYGGDTTGKSGYTRLGILAAASAADSLRNLRGKYPKLFMLLDGYDYPNSNAKNCSAAFDKFGHGAAACAGASVTLAWKQEESDGTDYLVHAQAAIQRMKKNLTRYVSVL